MALDITGPYRYPSPNGAWLDQVREEVIEPALPIIDPHHHLWEQDGQRYLLNDWLADLGTGHNVVRTVFVQCHYAHRPDGPEELRPVGETERVAAIAAEADRRGAGVRVCAGIVGHADLRLGDRIDPVIEAHLAAAGGRFRGLRHSAARDRHFPNGIVLRPAPAGLLADLAFRRGLARVAAHGLAFDAMIYHEQLGELVDLARAVPDAPIVLDHLGCPLGVGPYREARSEVFAAWRAGIRALAACPNAHVKLGGLGMIICGFDFHERPRPPSSQELCDAWRPYVETCIEAFGPKRCMFESNFPVDKAMFSYPVLWNAFKRLTSGSSPDEKAALFHDSAARFFRLP